MSRTISVVVPLYNKYDTIERCLSSIISQTISPIEVIVVNDGSTDCSFDIVEKVIYKNPDKPIRVVSQNNAGEGAARNTGIKEASGQYIAFLDADDEWTSFFLERISDLIADHPAAGIYATAYEECSADGTTRQRYFACLPPSGRGIIDYFKSAGFGEPPVCSSAVCIPKSVFGDVGCFAINEPLGADLDMWARIAFKYSVAYNAEVSAIYHKVPSKILGLKSVYLPLFTSFDKAIHSGDISEQQREDVEEYIAKLKLSFIRVGVISGDKEKTKILLRSFTTKRFIRKKLYWSALSFIPAFITAYLYKIKRKVSRKNIQKTL